MQLIVNACGLKVISNVVSIVVSYRKQESKQFTGKTSLDCEYVQHRWLASCVRPLLASCVRTLPSSPDVCVHPLLSALACTRRPIRTAACKLISSLRCQGILQSAPTPPVGSQHSCQPSKTPYVNPSMHVSSWEGVVRGRRGQQLKFAFCVQSDK